MIKDGRVSSAIGNRNKNTGSPLLTINPDTFPVTTGSSRSQWEDIFPVLQPMSPAAPINHHQQLTGIPYSGAAAISSSPFETPNSQSKPELYYEETKNFWKLNRGIHMTMLKHSSYHCLELIATDATDRHVEANNEHIFIDLIKLTQICSKDNDFEIDSSSSYHSPNDKGGQIKRNLPPVADRSGPHVLKQRMVKYIMDRVSMELIDTFSSQSDNKNKSNRNRLKSGGIRRPTTGTLKDSTIDTTSDFRIVLIPLAGDDAVFVQMESGGESNNTVCQLDIVCSRPTSLSPSPSKSKNTAQSTDTWTKDSSPEVPTRRGKPSNEQKQLTDASKWSFHYSSTAFFRDDDNQSDDDHSNNARGSPWSAQQNSSPESVHSTQRYQPWESPVSKKESTEPSPKDRIKSAITPIQQDNVHPYLWQSSPLSQEQERPQTSQMRSRPGTTSESKRILPPTASANSVNVSPTYPLSSLNISSPSFRDIMGSGSSSQLPMFDTVTLSSPFLSTGSTSTVRGVSARGTGNNGDKSRTRVLNPLMNEASTFSKPTINTVLSSSSATTTAPISSNVSSNSISPNHSSSPANRDWDKITRTTSSGSSSAAISPIRTPKHVVVKLPPLQRPTIAVKETEDAMN